MQAQSLRNSHTRLTFVVPGVRPPYCFILKSAQKKKKPVFPIESPGHLQGCVCMSVPACLHACMCGVDVCVCSVYETMMLQPQPCL